MSQEESSYQAVRNPSRHIRKTLLDVLFTASAELKSIINYQMDESPSLQLISFPTFKLP